MSTKQPENVEDIYALSPLQSGMLFHSLYADRPGFYVQQQVYQLDGDLDTDSFKRAWQHIVARHPALRTSFHWEKLKEPMQVVHRSVDLPLEILDWRGVDPEDQGIRFEALATEHREQGVDITRAPLMRLALVYTSDNIWRLLWSYHHLILDRWSVSIVVSELAAAYNVIRDRRSIELPPIRPYRDYIRWLRQQDSVKAETYWRNKLAGFTSPTSLPIDRAPAGHQGGSIPAEAHARLSETTTSALQSLARTRRLTINTLIQGAWALLLSRYTGERDVVFGATVSGRPASLGGVESMVGLFINSIPVRVNVPDAEPVSTWLEKLQGEMVELREYEHSSLVQIQGWSEVSRGTSIYDSLVVVQNTPGGFTTGEQLDDTTSARLNLRPVDGRTAVDFPLLLRVGLGRQLRLTAAYDEERFAADDINRLLDHLQRVLESLVSNPEQRCSEIALLTEAESARILTEWNQTECPFPDRRLHQLVEEQADRTPDGVAVRYENSVLTYRELDERANRLANYIRTLGIGPESYVGVFMERSLDLVVALLAVLKAGSAYVPLDPEYPAARIAYMLENSQVGLVLTQESLAEKLPEHAAMTVSVHTDVFMSSPVTRPNVAVDPEHPAYVIYTSGTTGRPKGVVVPHRAIVNHMQWMQQTYPLRPNDRVIQKTPISFDASVWECWAPLMSGGELIVARPGGHTDSEYLIGLIREQGITAIKLVPSLLRMLLEEECFADCRSLRNVLCGAEALSKDLHDRFLATFGDRVQLSNLYGPTEAAIDAVGYLCSGECTTPTVPIGHPISNCTAYILDSKLRPAPVSIPGELYLGGTNVARGYLNAADLTAERFVPDPFAQGAARLYRTGDRARYLSDGSIEFLGRVDHQVKVRGFRIELGEIETALQSHKTVRDCVVVAREDSPAAQSLAAYIAGESIDVAAVRQHLKALLPDYMVPSSFTVLDALPRTTAGKVDRKALPSPDSPTWTVQESVAPRTPLEEGLVEIWQAILKVDQVGVHDSFFELGGHSLLATQMISRIRSAFQVELPLRALFEYPTIAELAGRIQDERGSAQEAAPPLTKVSRENPLPLSFAQQRLWFLDQLEPDSTLYNIPTALRLGGRLDINALGSALNEIVRRHESLRTTFEYGDGDPVQIIQPPVEVAINTIDLTGLPDDARADEARAHIRAEASRPFNLARGPLFRVGVLRLAEEEHVLLITIHHIVFDAWSGGVLWREIAALYNAFLSGNRSPLAELAVQYPDYAVWQRGWLKGDVLDRHLEYWNKKLSGAPALLELPADRPRPPVMSYRGAVTGMEIPVELADGIRSLAQREGVTLFMLLLAAFQTLLHRYTAQVDIVVGTPIANRTRPEIEGVIGFFVNTLALRSNLSGDPTFRELLAQLRNTCLEAYTHQDLPFEKIVDEIHSQRSLSHSPIFQTAFVLQNAPLESMTLNGLEVQRIGGDSVTAKFDLILGASQTAGKLRFGLEYSTDLFDKDRMERLLGHYRTLLERIVADPRSRISRLPILTQAERTQLDVLNHTANDNVQPRCFHELFEARVDAAPNALALVFGEDRLTYAELESHANRLAYYLCTKDIGPESLVGICMERSIDMIVAVLGVLKTGAAYVPLDPTYPPERLSFMAQDSKAKLIVTKSHLNLRVPDLNRSVCLDHEWDRISSQPDTRPDSGGWLDNPAYVIYTSGSTGQPKGVVVTHRGIANLAFSQQSVLGTSADDRVFQFASLSFDASVFDIVMALASGACLYIGTKDELLPGPPLGDFIRSHEITAATLPPTALAPMDPNDVPTLQKLSVAGEACPLDLAQRWGRGRRFFNLYGPTESTIWATYLEAGPDLDSISIGCPLPNVQVHILDNNLSPVPIGVPGELCIGADGLARGYLNRPDLTAEKFVPNPFAVDVGRRAGSLDSRVRGNDGGGGNDGTLSTLNSQLSTRLYRTGDLARYRSDGNIEFLGRLDHQVKVRGFRIELGEIESAIAAHPAVDEAVVIAREDVPGEKRLTAYVVSANGALSTGELRDHIRGRLPDYMIPHTFMTLDALPLSPSGKVDRKALPAPDGERPEIDSSYTPARTTPEETLVNIWQDVLRIEHVGVHDNFFELGGDSILSIQIIARANQAGLRLTPRNLFQYQTVAGLAEAAGTGKKMEAEQGPIQGDLPLTPIQRWFFDLDLPDPHHFNQARLLQLIPSVTPEQVKTVVSALVSHHDSLRLRFTQSEIGWVQSNALEETNEFFEVIDLSDLDVANQPEAITSACARVQASLGLEHGPLIRAAFFKLGEERPSRLFVAIHHLCVDGVSWRILLEDIETALGQIDRGQSIVLPSKTSSFKQWAERLEQYANSPQIEEELDYWQSVIASPCPTPLDHAGGVNSADSERSIRVSLGEEKTRELLTQVPAVYNTQIQEALLTALARSICGWTGDRFVQIDLEGHGREDVFDDIDLSRTVGWFTSLYPIRLESSPSSDIGEALKTVKESVRTIPGRGIGYGLLRYLNKKPVVQQALVQQVRSQLSFNYHGQFTTGEGSAYIAAAPEPSGPSHSSKGERTHIIDVIAQVNKERLNVTWLYSENLHNRSTIESLATSYLAALRELITHCKSGEAGGFTPSDFPEATVSQKSLDRLLAGLRKK